MVIIPYILYMKKNLTIHRLSTPSLILIAQSTAEKRHTLLLLSSFGHPVELLDNLKEPQHRAINRIHICLQILFTFKQLLAFEFFRFPIGRGCFYAIYVDHFNG